MALFALEDEYEGIAQQMQLDVEMGEFMPPLLLPPPSTPRPARLGEAVPFGDEALLGEGAGALAPATVLDEVPSPIARLPPPAAPVPHVRHARQPRKVRPDLNTRISSTQMTLALNDPSDLVADLAEVRLVSLVSWFLLRHYYEKILIDILVLVSYFV